MGTANFPADLHPHMVTFPKELKKTDVVVLDEVPNYISSENWANGWKKMTKITSSAKLSGLYFSYLKACTTDHFLGSFESSLSHTTYNLGSAPSSCSNSIICMIKKKISG